jgi:hypothetical protein
MIKRNKVKASIIFILIFSLALHAGQITQISVPDDEIAATRLMITNFFNILGNGVSLVAAKKHDKDARANAGTHMLQSACNICVLATKGIPISDSISDADTGIMDTDATSLLIELEETDRSS